MSANEKQVAGDHYKKYSIQVWDAIVDWNLGYLDGAAVKYLARWKDKNGLQDLKKAMHYIEKLIEIEEKKQAAVNIAATISLKQHWEIQQEINDTRAKDALLRQSTAYKQEK